MNPIDTVRWVRMEHEALSELLREARSLGSVALPQAKRELRQMVMLFLSHVEHHFAKEEDGLVPLMKRAGLWTPERAGRFESDHAHQRKLLTLMGQHPRDAGPEVVLALAQLADAFSEESSREALDINTIIDRLDLR